MSEGSITAHASIGRLFEYSGYTSQMDAERSHLDSCPSCQGKVSWMRLMRDMGSAELDHEPPEEIIANVLKLVPTTRRQVAPRPTLASWVYDSFKEMRKAGERY